MGLTDFNLILKGPNGVGRIAELVDVLLDDIRFDLNGPGGATISMSPLHPQASLIQLNKTEIEIWDETGIVHHVVPRTAKGGLDRVTFGCEGVLSYLMGSFVVEDDLNYEALDQFTIGWNLITVAQAQTDRNIDSAFFDDSGVARTVLYLASEMPNIWDKLVELTQLENGFDFDIVLFGDGRREWTPYYPFKGAIKRQYALELNRRGKRYIKNFEYAEDGPQQGTEVFISGGTLEDTSTDPPTRIKMVGHAEDLPSIAAGYGRIQKVITNTNITDQAYLDDQAAAYVAALKTPPILPTLQVDGGLRGLIETGDILPLNVDYGRYQIQGDVRITSIVYSGQSDDIGLTVQLVA